MTGSGGASSTPRIVGSCGTVSGILGRPVEPGDDIEKDNTEYSRGAFSPE
jgi:hypothetical protein